MATMQSIHTAVPANLTALPLQQPQELPAASGRWRERLARRWGRPLLEGMFSKRRAIIAELRSIPERMQKVTNQARLMMELADDFRSGRYRQISWVSIAVAAAALVYAVSPGDVIPDALPGLGAVDDMLVITVAMRFLERDLKAYCRFRGYAETDYF
jgi:uncharacterized membrane protein YkvA (DUF1232 family)